MEGKKRRPEFAVRMEPPEGVVPMRIDVYHHFMDFELNNKLNEILAVVKAIKQEEDTMTAQLEALQAAVAENEILQASAITLLEGLSAKIIELKDDPAALQALADEVTAKSAALAAAIQANTPQA
jgi:hypothetical protein